MTQLGHEIFHNLKYVIDVMRKHLQAFKDTRV